MTTPPPSATPLRPLPAGLIDPAVGVVETYPTEAEWLAARRRGIGASEIAAVLGLSRYASPASVWADKCGLAEPAAEIERLRWGKRLQRPIVDGWRDETGRIVCDPGPYTLVRSVRYPWLFASPDYIQVETDARPVPGVVDVKNVSEYARREWDTSGPPVAYELQLHAQMLATGFGYGTLVALFGGATLGFVDCVARSDVADWILEDTGVFWRYVQRGTPPPQLDGSAATTAALHRLYPSTDAGPVVLLPDDAIKWDRIIATGLADIAQLEEDVDAAKNALRAAIGAYEAGRLPDGALWTHKLERRKEYTKLVPAWEGRVLRRRGPARDAR